MGWSKKMPAEPGRYWWRRYDSKWKTSAYGLALVSWREAFDIEASPRLEVRSVCVMGSAYGHDERVLGMGWASSSGVEAGTEWWSEPVQGPPLLLPDLPGKPAPPDPKAVAALRDRQRAAQTKAKAEEDDRAKTRARAIAQAVKQRATLYCCPDCEELFSPTDLVARRECSNCGTQFSSEDRACPDCDRTFTRKEHDLACPDCDCDEECCLLVDEGVLVDDGARIT